MANVIRHCGTGPPRSRLLNFCRLALLSIVLALGPPALYAADNAVIGGIGGTNNGTLLGGDGTGTARIALVSVNLALVKQARDAGGTVLSDGSNVAPGQEIYFVLYVDNSTVINTPLQITDLLNESEFTYIDNSIEVTTVPTGSSDAAIWSGTWSPLTDVLGGPDDGASFVDTGGVAEKDQLTIGDVTGQTNQVFSAPANSIRAIRFRVRVD